MHFFYLTYFSYSRQFCKYIIFVISFIIYTKNMRSENFPKIVYVSTYTIVNMASRRVVTAVALAYAVRLSTWNYPVAILSLRLFRPFFFPSFPEPLRREQKEKLFITLVRSSYKSFLRRGILDFFFYYFQCKSSKMKLNCFDADESVYISNLII